MSEDKGNAELDWETLEDTGSFHSLTPPDAVPQAVSSPRKPLTNAAPRVVSPHKKISRANTTRKKTSKKGRDAHYKEQSARGDMWDEFNEISDRFMERKRDRRRK